MTNMCGIVLRMTWRNRLMYLAAIAVSLLLLIAAIWLLANVDDWSRDFTTNYAATAASAKKDSLRPIISERTSPELADLVTTAAQKPRGWELASRVDSPDEITLRFVRTTRLMRFKDDITVHIRPAKDAPHPQSDEQSNEISAESQSRVGKGDFGQNPRNLVELMDTLRTLLQ